MTSRKSKVISLSLAQGVLLIVSIVSGMVFTRTLTLADYGTYLQTFLAYDFAVPILTMGLPSALYYFLPGEKERKKGLVLDNLFLLFIAAIIFSLFLVLGGTELLSKRFNNIDLSKTLHWMAFYPIYTFPVLLAGAVWVIQDKVKLNAMYNVFTGIILTISLITAALLTRSYEAPTLIRIFLPILFLPVTLYFVFKNLPGEWDKPRFSSMWNMVKFSIPLGLASVLGTITQQMSNMIVSLLTSPADYAIYANGAKEVPFINIITGSIAVVIMAEMAQRIKQNDLKQAIELFRKSAVISASFLLPVMVFLMIYAESFINILYSSKYESSVVPFRIYLLVIPVRIAYYAPAFIALGKTKAILKRSVIDLLLTALFSYSFVLWLGAYGAAIGLVLTMFVWSVPYNLHTLGNEFNCKTFYILPFSMVGRILLISIIAGVVSALCLLLHASSFVLFSLGFGVYGIIYCILAFRFIPEFKDQANPYLNRLLTR